MKNRVLLENYYLTSDLERHIEAFIDCDNNQRYHESLEQPDALRLVSRQRR